MTMRRIGTELITALLVVIFLAGNVLPAFAENTAKPGAKTYSDAQTSSDIVTYSDAQTYSSLNTYSDLVTYSDFVTYVESYVYTDFYEYVDDVEVVVLQPGDYRNSSLLLNNGRELDIGKVAENAIEGLHDIVTVGLTMGAVPGVGPIAVIVVASATVITAAIAGTITYINSGGDTAKAIENASTGFMWAAMASKLIVPFAVEKIAFRTAKAGAASVKSIQEVSKQGIQTTVKVADKADDVGKVVAEGVRVADTRYIKDYGILPYDILYAKTKGSGLQAHHLIEKRLVRILGIDQGQILSIPLEASQHQIFTNAWRKVIPYGSGTANATKDEIFAAAREIYKDYPEILQALGKQFPEVLQKVLM